MLKIIVNFILAFAMVLILSPLRVQAEEAAATVNEVTGREAGPVGNRQVAVMVYGESITEIATRKNYTFRDFQAALKRELQGVLANEKLPDVEMYLVNDQNQEYKLTKDAVLMPLSCLHSNTGHMDLSAILSIFTAGFRVSDSGLFLIVTHMGNSTEFTVPRMCLKAIIRLKSERSAAKDIFLISPAAEV